MNRDQSGPVMYANADSDDAPWRRRGGFKPLTPAWRGRCLNAMEVELQMNLGEKTLHAIEGDLELFHSWGLKAEQAGKILAHNYRMRHKLNKEKEFVTGEKDRALAELRRLGAIPKPSTPAPKPPVAQRTQQTQHPYPVASSPALPGGVQLVKQRVDEVADELLDDAGDSAGNR